jgi:hypothetical protein
MCCAVLWPAAPFSDIYRGMALIGVKGFSALPKHCATLMLVFFVSGVGVLCVLQHSLQLGLCDSTGWLFWQHALQPVS